MLPIQLITGLFTATIVGATATFARSPEFTAIGWFMYLYLIGYRTKVFLDDLVYYENLKQDALAAGDPAIGLISWVLWITVGLQLQNEMVYFLLTATTFGLGVVWVLVAKRNVRRAQSRLDPQVLSDTHAAHDRWLRFNMLPAFVCAVYFVIYVAGGTLNWTSVLPWLGPVALAVFFLWDVVTGYRFMFRIPSNGQP